MKYPKLWNGASPVGEALVRALQKSNTPYLSAHTADGVQANKMQGRSEVFVEPGGGGFIFQPARTNGNTITYLGSSDLRLQFKPYTFGHSAKTIPIYQVGSSSNPKYGQVDWQGAHPGEVLSWNAWTWMGPPRWRYDPYTESRADRWFYDVMRSTYTFVMVNNFTDRTFLGYGREFTTPTLRYQCVGSGTKVYKNRHVWRELAEDQRLSNRDFIQGAVISSYDNRSGCFVFLREVDNTDSAYSDGDFIRAGWLNPDGTFDETHRFDASWAVAKTVQGWYFNRSGTRGVCVFEGCEVLEFTHERGFRLIESWIKWKDPYHPFKNSFMLGRDFFGDEVLKLDIMPNPFPYMEFVGHTVKKGADGIYKAVDWRIPQLKWDWQPDGDDWVWPHFASRAIAADLRAGILVVIEGTYSKQEGAWEQPYLSSTYKPIVLGADLVVYQHGVELVRKTIPM